MTQAATQPAGLSPEDKAEITALQPKFESALLGKDFGSLANLYTADATLMPPHQPAVKGRDAIREWMAGFPSLTEFTLGIDEIDGRGDMAFVVGTYTMTMEIEGESVADQGKYMEVRLREPNGQWSIHADIFNSDQE